MTCLAYVACGCDSNSLLTQAHHGLAQGSPLLRDSSHGRLQPEGLVKGSEDVGCSDSGFSSRMSENGGPECASERAGQYLLVQDTQVETVLRKRLTRISESRQYGAS